MGGWVERHIERKREMQEIMELAGNAFNGAVFSALVSGAFAVSPWTQIFQGAASNTEIGDEEGRESEVVSAVSTPLVSLSDDD